MAGQYQFIASQALTASSSGTNLIATWSGRFPPFRALVTLLVRATTTGVRLTLTSGQDAVQPRGPVQGGGTAGNTPSPLNTTAIQWINEAGAEIQPLLDEVLAGTPTVDLLISYEAV